MKGKIFSFFVVKPQILIDTCLKEAGNKYQIYTENGKWVSEIKEVLTLKELKTWACIENMPLQRCIISEEKISTRLLVFLYDKDGNEVKNGSYSIGLSENLVEKLRSQLSVESVHHLIVKFEENSLVKFSSKEIKEIRDFINEIRACLSAPVIA
jgi:hypothetical protein